jgi:hypothetical protein
MRKVIFSVSISREADGTFEVRIQTPAGKEKHTCDTQLRAQWVVTRALGSVVLDVSLEEASV